MVNSVATDGRRATLMLSRDRPRKSILLREASRLGRTMGAVLESTRLAPLQVMLSWRAP